MLIFICVSSGNLWPSEPDVFRICGDLSNRIIQGHGVSKLDRPGLRLSIASFTGEFLPWSAGDLYIPD